MTVNPRSRLDPERTSAFNGAMTAQLDLRSYIRSIPDFPEPGILFRDVTPLLKAPEAYRQALDEMMSYVNDMETTSIVAVEARGFLFGCPLAAMLGVPFVPVRKQGKLPSDCMTIEYALEYGQGQLDIHADAIEAGARVAIIDDLIATGGTAAATAQLIELVGGTVAGFVFLVELQGLGGREKIGPYRVETLIKFD
jgi:adenine phosphoribosyltransferase